MKSKILLFVGVVIICLFGFILTPSLTALTTAMVLKSSLFVVIILSLGNLILTIKETTGQIVQRFMIATTMQMLASMFFLLIITQTGKILLFEQAIFLIVLFMSGVILQSVYLIKKVNR
jgi:hypothetical protein